MKSTIERRKTGLIHWDMDWSSGCYTLYTPQTGNGLVKLIDITGETVHEWNMPVRPGRDAVILPNGNLGYNGCHNTSVDLYPPWDIWHGGHFMEADRKSNIVWEYEDPYAHHDAQWLPDGSLLYVAAAEYRFDYDWGCEVSDIVRIVNRAGETTWEWCAWEHLQPEDWPVHNGMPDVHWPMINGVHLHDNLVYMSLRNTSGIIGVHIDSKNIVWQKKWPDVAQQHCPVVTDKGTLIAFCNGNIRPPSVHHSRIVEFDLASKEMVWSYVDDMPPSFFSPYMGSVQRLWNGNTFICESAFGRLFEVTPEGETVWEYVIPDFAEYPEPLNKFITGRQNSCFKAHRYKEWQ